VLFSVLKIVKELGVEFVVPPVVEGEE